MPHALEQVNGRVSILCLDSQTGEVSRRLALAPSGGLRPASKFHSVHVIEKQLVGCSLGHAQLEVPNVAAAWKARFPSFSRMRQCLQRHLPLFACDGVIVPADQHGASGAVVARL